MRFPFLQRRLHQAATATPASTDTVMSAVEPDPAANPRPDAEQT